MGRGGRERKTEQDGVVEKEVVREEGEGGGRWDETKLQKTKSQFSMIILCSPIQAIMFSRQLS